MARRKRVLSGTAKDAFLRRLLAAEAGLDEATRSRLTESLQAAISLISTRQNAHDLAVPRSVPATPEAPPVASVPAAQHPPPQCSATETAATLQPFDPFTPNVIVVFRTRGREAALEELESIAEIECLRLLAREQQLGIDVELADPREIRLAIVDAAERRIANRRAAAS